MSVLRPDENSKDIEDIVFLYRYISFPHFFFCCPENVFFFVDWSRPHSFDFDPEAGGCRVSLKNLLVFNAPNNVLPRYLCVGNFMRLHQLCKMFCEGKAIQSIFKAFDIPVSKLFKHGDSLYAALRSILDPSSFHYVVFSCDLLKELRKVLKVECYFMTLQACSWASTSQLW